MGKPGMIYKITIKNFVTYSYVEVYPRTNLNIVIGPNGTGKSTIVAAIILGLGGSPKMIGRGTKVSDYVRHNCSESYICVEIFTEKSNVLHKIARIFNLSNHNTWYLDDKSVSESEIKNLVRKYNIQINNLCQFLPQDRVQDFAKMDKKELLLNTQKAVSRLDLAGKQEELIRLRGNQKLLKKDAELLNSKMEQSKSDISRLEGRVKNLSEKKKFKEEIDNVKRKIMWETFETLQRTKNTVENDRAQAEELMNLQKSRILPVEEMIKKRKNDVKTLQDLIIQAKNSESKSKEKIKVVLENVQNVQNTRREICIEKNAKLQRLAEYKNETDAMKAKIDKLVNDEQSFCTKYGEISEIDKTVGLLTKEENVHSRKMEEINQQRIRMKTLLRITADKMKNLEERLQEMENVKEKRLQILKRRNLDTYEAVLWLRENRHLFRSKVHEPMILELNVIDPSNSKYLENIIPNRDRVAFTCESREDMNLLLERVRDQQGKMINVLHSGPEHPPLTSYRAPIPIEQLRKFGFFAYTTSLITGPEAIIKYLCRMYALHCIPVGDSTTYNKSAKVPPQIHLFFSDQHRFSVSTSRYTREKSMRITDVISDGTFSVCVDYDGMNEVRRQYEESANKSRTISMNVEEIPRQEEILENERAELLKRKQDLLHCKQSIKMIREKISAAQNAMKKQMAEHKTAAEIEEETNLEMKALVKKSVELHKSLQRHFVDRNKHFESTHLTSLQLNAKHTEISKMESEIADLRSDFEEIKNTFNRIDAIYKMAKHDANKALDSAKNLTGGFKPGDSGFEKFGANFETLPSDIEGLKVLLHELQTKVECILTADDGELKAYENGQRLISACSEELKLKNKNLEEGDKKIQKIYQEWIQPITELVAEINRNFSNYFESMSCAGEVVISHDSGIDEYSEYGLSVRVTYRADEPLQELNRYIQSGGERAVATAVFMLSMQDLTVAPFRCVDEINQGMDQQNERRIFEILVKATSRENAGQYFLITPKLIPGLEFGNATKVHIIHNGFFSSGQNERRRTLNEN